MLGTPWLARTKESPRAVSPDSDPVVVGLRSYSFLPHFAVFPIAPWVPRISDVTHCIGWRFAAVCGHSGVRPIWQGLSSLFAGDSTVNCWCGTP